MKKVTSIFVCNMLIILLAVLACNNQDEIGFEVLNMIEIEKTKGDSLSVDDNEDKVYYQILFYNRSKKNIYIETKYSVFCYTYKEISYDSNSHIIGAGNGESIPNPDLLSIKPGYNASFLCAPFTVLGDAKFVAVKFVYYQDSMSNARNFMQKKFRVKKDSINPFGLDRIKSNSFEGLKTYVKINVK